MVQNKLIECLWWASRIFLLVNLGFVVTIMNEENQLYLIWLFQGENDLHLRDEGTEAHWFSQDHRGSKEGQENNQSSTVQLLA